MKKIFNSSLAKLLYSILAIFIVQSFSSFFVSDRLNWLASLKKPIFTPPSYIFSPIWTLLYVLIAISFWIIWTNKHHHKKNAYISFFLQIALNMSWTFFFFFLKSPALGLIDILLLNFAIGINIFYFWKISKAAACLLIPYWAWVLIATYLNAGYWVLN